MISRIYRTLLTISLGSFFSVVVVFGVAVDNSWATTSFTQFMGSPQTPIAALDDRAKAVTKNLEGKAQEAISHITGDMKNQVEGRAKQAEASTRHLTENIKDSAKLPGRVKATTRNFEGKAQEAIGNITGDPKDQISGKSKQIESKARNLLEDVKEKIQGFFK